jgi:hypothetical protein
MVSVAAVVVLPKYEAWIAQVPAVTVAAQPLVKVKLVALFCATDTVEEQPDPVAVKVVAVQAVVAPWAPLQVPVVGDKENVHCAAVTVTASVNVAVPAAVVLSVVVLLYVPAAAPLKYMTVTLQVEPTVITLLAVQVVVRAIQWTLSL